MLKTGIYLLLFVCYALTTGCQRNDNTNNTNAEPVSAYISGIISYRERMALTDRATLEISLQDISLADAPARVIAKQQIDDPGQVPIRFKLEYPREEIDERRRYALQFRISDRNQLLFVNDTQVPVLTRGAGRQVTVTLIGLQNSTPAETSALDEKPGMMLEGMFQYMADAALFRDCRNNLVFPVSMEAHYGELERTYLNAGVSPGSEMFFRLKGRYLERDGYDGKTNTIMLIVDKLNEFSTDKTCAPTVHAELENTYWKLTKLRGKRVTTPEGMREAHLILASSDTRAHGFAGCNNFFGGYQVDGTNLSFSDMGVTMMACPEGMETEQAFLQILAEVTGSEIEGQIMKLYAGDRLLASFEAVYL
jgi:uncharacterized lipoprotein YbaY/heat shock protein HslJ